ncbi:hypothetical protein [Tenacibaculum sp. 190524A02b]|uniref:hypothetical protein n=1 Tax=Tenacibaculum vairaonense TaxID=3137860 RepID=UPI0032B28202
MISAMIDERIAGISIGASHYESEGDFEGMRKIEEEGIKLSTELDSLIGNLNNL